MVSADDSMMDQRSDKNSTPTTQGGNEMALVRKGNDNLNLSDATMRAQQPWTSITERPDSEPSLRITSEDLGPFVREVVMEQAKLDARELAEEVARSTAQHSLSVS